MYQYRHKTYLYHIRCQNIAVYRKIYCPNPTQNMTEVDQYFKQVDKSKVSEQTTESKSEYLLLSNHKDSNYYLRLILTLVSTTNFSAQFNRNLSFEQIHRFSNFQHLNFKQNRSFAAKYSHNVTPGWSAFLLRKEKTLKKFVLSHLQNKEMLESKHSPQRGERAEC